MKLRNTWAVVCAMAVLFVASVAQAADRYWSGNGVSLGGAGTWDITTATNWGSTVSGPFGTMWVNANKDSARFSGTANTVTLGATIDVGGLWFDTTAYTLTTTGFTLGFVAANNTITLNAIAAATITGPVGGAGNVTLTTPNPATAGTVSFGGISTGGWSGTTTVNAGIRLEMAGNVNNQALLNTTGITLNGGTIAMGNVTTAIGGSQATLNRINDSATITSYGGAIAYDVNNGSLNSETVGTLDLVYGQFSLTEAFALSSGSSTFIFSGLSRTGSGNTSVLNLQTKNTALSTSGFQRVVIGGVGANTPAGQIVGPWFTTLSGNGAVADYIVYTNGGSGSIYYAIPAGSRLTAPGQGGWSSNTTAYQFGAAETLMANRTAAALRYTGAAAALGLGASTFTLETYGILNAGSGLLTISTTGTGCLTTPSTLSGTTNNLFLTTTVNAITVSAPIKDNTSVVTLVKSGGSTLTLSGNNTYTGGLVLNAGTLLLSGAQSFTGGVTLNGGTFGNSTDAISAAELNNNSVTVNGVAAMVITSGETLTSSSGILVNSSGNLSLGSTSSATVNGVLSGSGIVTVPSAAGNGGGATLTLSNTANTLTGGVFFAPTANGVYILNVNSLPDSASPGAGNIIMAVNGAVASDLKFNLNSGAVAPMAFTNRQFELLGNASGQAVRIANNSTQAFTINSDLNANAATGTKTLTLQGAGAGLSTFGGKIGNGTLTSLAIAKGESGTWVLSGTNTYSGATTISGGKLVGVVGGSCSNSAVTVSAGTLGVSVTDITKQWTCASLTHTAASTLEFAFGGNTPSATVAPLKVNGNVMLVVAPTVNCTGTTLPAGTYPLVKWTGTFSGVAPSSLTLSSGTGILVKDDANKTIWLSISVTGGSKQPLTWKGPTTSIWVANEAVYTKWQDATPVNTNYQENTAGSITVGDNVVFGATGAGTVTLNTTVYPASVQVNTAGSYTISGSGSIGGVGSLTKSSSSTLTLYTANSYSGGTLLSAGTLSIGINDALGTGSVVLGSGTIQSSDATARTLNNPVVLNGSTTVGGSGNLSFTSAGAGSVVAASTLTVNTGLNATIATALSGAGSITKAGAGTMTLTGTNIYSGGTTVSAGRLVVDGGQISHTPAAVTVGSATMVFTNGAKVFSGGAASTIGTSGSGNAMTIVGGSGGTSLWDLGNRHLAVGNGTGPINFVIDGAGVAGSAVVTNINKLQDSDATAFTSAYSSIILTNGAQMFVNGAVELGNPYYNTTGNNSIKIMGGTATSTFTGNNQAFYIGYGERNASKNNEVTINSGGALTGVGNMVVGNVNYGTALGTSTANKLTVDGTGTASMASVTVGYAQVNVDAANANLVVVSNGGQLSTSSGANYIGRATVSGAQAKANTATVSGTGSSWNAGNQTVYVGNAVSGAVSISNVLTASTGGMVTNISALIVSATNTLSLGVGGTIYANAVTNAGTLAVALDGSANPTCGHLNVSGNLNLNNTTLNVTVGANPSAPCVIATYKTLTGAFSVTNLPANYSLDTGYNNNTQIAVKFMAAGTLIQFM